MAEQVESPAEALEAARELLTLDELTARVQMSVRNVRFYTTKGLVPPPIRRGRSGYYTPDHVARLALVQELQAHGFTLAAIEKYVADIPDDASAEDVALHRTMVAPWMSDHPVELSRADICGRAGRELADEDFDTLEAMEILHPLPDDRYQVAVTQLAVGLGLLEIGYPVEAAKAARELYNRHGQEMARELLELFRTQVWPAYRESGMTPERLQQVVERIKPLSVASLVTAYEAAMDAATREDIARRNR
ncbi:MerR family transcriptional regulator [Nocardioides gilvus]|uniref:MerR family transcriptional regulator n=1 Tax=Nocardioides gilvus TaxID=1735589 RepID=UPI000D74DC5E|nr:MerR family transcriptional regulator [Nocardioides gilvus]